MRPPESLEEYRRANVVFPARERGGGCGDVYGLFASTADPDQSAKAAPYTNNHQRRQQLPDYEDRYDSSTVTYSESAALNVAFSNAAGCIEGSWPVEAQGAGECGIGLQAGTTSWIYYSGLDAHSNLNSATYVESTAVAANWHDFRGQMQRNVEHPCGFGHEMSASLAAIVSPANVEASGLYRFCAGPRGRPRPGSGGNETNIFSWSANRITPLLITASTSGMAISAGDRKTRTKDKYRVVYTDQQRAELEKAFLNNRYVTARMKAELAQLLNLSERQIKIWFQNRRAKERKQSKRHISTAATGTSVTVPDAREIGMTDGYFVATGDEIFPKM